MFIVFVLTNIIYEEAGGVNSTINSNIISQWQVDLGLIPNNTVIVPHRLNESESATYLNTVLNTSKFTAESMASLISKDLSSMQGTKWPAMWHPRTVQQATTKTVSIIYAGPAWTSACSAIVFHHAQVATMATHTT